MSSSFIPRLSVLSLSLFLAACNFAPKYEQPAAPIASEYVKPGVAGQTAADISWQNFFQDARLKAIIQLALDNNRDLRIATQRVDEARAQYGITNSALFPNLGLSGEATHGRMPADMSQTRTRDTTHSYVVGAGLNSFELDFWGRVRNNSETALQNYFATEQAQRAAHISLVAAVANTYFTVRTMEEMESLVSRTLNAYQNTYNLVNSRYKAGVASLLEVNQAKTTLDTARANLAEIQRNRGQAENALTLLVGQALPTSLPNAPSFGHDVLVAKVPAGLPSDLLTCRPDIIAAEHQLKGANAQIGAARAAFFPRISLTGMLGLASLEMNQLFDGGREMWSFSPSIGLPIFTAGALRNSLDVAEIRKDMQIANYEKTIQTAFKEVNDALIGIDTYKRQLDALREQQQAAYQSFNLSNLRYTSGIDSFLQVQSAQVALLGVQQNFLAVGLESLQNKVNLYKALGGGWSSSDLVQQVK